MQEWTRTWTGAKRNAWTWCAFYLGHISDHILYSLSSLYRSAGPSPKECAFQINCLSSFPFHLTRSLQPSMWMAKTCKRLDEKKKQRGSGWEEHGEKEGWLENKDGRGGRGGERMRSQRRFPNKADLLFCSSLQGCNSLLGFLHPSIPVFILPFSSSFSKLLSSRAKCANAIRRHLPCRFCASINLPDRVGCCCCCCPGKVSSLGTCFHLKLTKKKTTEYFPKCII